MQAEAGQSLETILRRKEIERAAGAGDFLWGVGNSVGVKLSQMLSRVPQPKVLFSVMKAKPKLEDSSPSEVVCWTSYVDLWGNKRELPPHALVLSRAVTKRGAKTHHYALVCRSERSLELHTRANLELGHFRNLGSSTPRIGASQVTAIIEHVAHSSEGPEYGVDLVADLVFPYFVRLVEPVPVPNRARQALNEIVNRPISILQWFEFLSELRVMVRPTQGMFICA